MKQPHIVVVGSLNMDLVVSMPRMPKLGETVSGTDIHTIPGGKGANQAIGCAKLGAKVTMIGAVGQDEFGDKILRQMKDHGIEPSCISRMDNVPTGTATIFHTSEDNCIVIVAGANGNCTPEFVSAYESLILTADVLLVQLEIPIESVAKALEIARKCSVRTVLNPAPAQKLSKGLLHLVDYLTPNETEFELLSGASYANDEDLRLGMRDWQDEFGPQLLITRGKHGGSFLYEGSLHTVPAPKVSVVDTTGAGDAFNAAFSVALASGKELNESVQFAVKSASLSVTRFGAQDGMPTLEELKMEP
ncbi:ribokinase [Paenibacillus sp. SYP-B3998]|uniref:Ribokinase n=1 Tax=Paenibacillus sp. SYP-B3998 TaxID=2678564 RepID=A0A6G4A1Q5_9BACL|nr:ribokinase [Paenibacillus sp. SYP-B3998]